jgi:acyl-CoA carboxylase epsilon subunit-like protein
MTPIIVRGNATAEEVAAVLALLSTRRPEEAPDGYRQWRATRLKSLQRKAFAERGEA